MPSPNAIQKLERVDADLYERRRDALDLYRGGAKYSEIETRFRLARQEVVRLLKRCLEMAPDGRIFGYRALTPGQRVGAYTRVKPLEAGSGDAGAWQLLMRTYPEVEALIRDTVYEPAEREGAEPLKFGQLWDTVREILQREGLTEDDYPFNKVKNGEGALRNHVKALQLADPEHTVRKRGGAQAAFRHNHIRVDAKRTFKPLRPCSYVILDYYPIDAITVVLVKNKVGEAFEITVPRFYVGVIVDELQWGILAVCATLEINPTADSAMETLDCMRNPERYIKSDMGDVVFDDKHIFIQQMVPEQAAKSISVLRLDNAWANAADAVIRGVCYQFGAAVHFGPARNWVSRAIAERVIGELARKGAQMAQSNVGSSVASRLHVDAAQQAVRYRVTIDQLMGLILEAALFHNRGRTARLGFSAPTTGLLKAHEAAVAGGPIVGIPLPRPTLQDNRFLDFEFIATIRGSLLTGVRPYIQFRDRRFTNSLLEARADLIGKEARCRIHYFDCDDMRAELVDGAIVFGRLKPDRRAGSGLSLRHEGLLRKATRPVKKREIRRTSRVKRAVERYFDEKEGRPPTGKEALHAAKQQFNVTRHVAAPSQPAPAALPEATVGLQQLPPVSAQTSNGEQDRFGLFTMKPKHRVRQ